MFARVALEPRSFGTSLTGPFFEAQAGSDPWSRYDRPQQGGMAVADSGAV